MFNVSKKTLSLVLCLTLIASVVVFCFAGSASAVTNAYQYPVYDEAVSLAANPEVKLDFDGEDRYGLPYHRGNDVSYNKEDFVTFTNSGGWAFIGNTGEALKNASDVDLGGTVNKTHADAAYVVDKYLYKVEANKTYNIVVDYKLLKGSVIISGRTISVKVDKTPSSPAEVANAVTSIIGNKVVWETNGVLQEGKLITVKDKDKNNVDVNVLTTDTDLQTMTATITSTADGYIALRTYMGDGDNYAATVAIDSIKIYNLTDLGSSVQNPISFDDGGVDFGRYMGNKYGYKTDDVDGNSNSYFWYDGTTDYDDDDKDGAWTSNVGTSTGSVYFSNDEYGKTWNSAINNSYDYSHMFKFLPGNSYEITFKFRIADPATYNLYDSRPEDLRELKQNKDIDIGKTTITPCFAKLPAGGSSGVIGLTETGISTYVKDLYYNGLAIENNPGSGIWQTVRICFTLNDTATIDADGLYFGLNGGGFVTEIDDYNVRELINYSVKTFDARNVSLDFEGTIPTHSASAGTVEFPSENGNTYMKYSGGGRFSFEQTRVLKADKKYYISFDAKSDDGCTHFNLVMGNPGSSSGSYRIFFNNNTGLQTALTESGSKFYIDGQEVSGYTNFKPSSKWQHFGFVLNLDSDAWKDVNSTGNTFNDSTWKGLEAGGGVYLLFGATTGTSVCYDNIKISQFDEIANAVPTTGGQVYRDAYTYSNDFDSITTSDLIQNTADTAKVEAETDRGNIVKLSSGASRFTIKGSDVLEKGYKYTISFDAKLDGSDNNDSKNLYLILANSGSDSKPRYFIQSSDGKTSSEDVLKAFKLYVGGEEVSYDKMDVTKEWQTYTIEFDYTNTAILDGTWGERKTDDKKVDFTDTAKYFHFGCANGWFDNLKIVKKEAVEYKDTTQVSIRQASGSGDSYVSAGLRFKNSLPNDVVAAADEIGFVVIPSSMATQAVDSWYKLDGTGSANAKTVVCKKPGYNWIYEKTITDTYYQLVLTGLSTESGATAYNRRFSAVMYTKKGDAYTYYALGETSYNQVGAIKDVINAQ